MGWSRIFQTNQVTFVMRSTTHLEFGLSCLTHSRKSMLLISCIARSKSSRLETRKGCSSTRLLLAEGWWYCKPPVSVLRRINPNEKLILNTVGWSAKMRLNCSRRLDGLIVDRRKLYQSWNLLWRLKRVRIWGQCCLYVSAIFCSVAGTRLAGISTGSSCQLEPAADAWVGAGCSDAVLALAWSVLLDFFAAGASVVLGAGRFLLAAAGCAVECAVRTWALKGARLWKVSPHVPQVKVRSATRLSWALRWRLRADLSENFWSQRGHWWGFSPVWIRLCPFKLPERLKVLPQVSQRCSLRGFLAGGCPSPTWISYNSII